MGTCARKWALAFSGGAGRTRFSTPAPTLGHTCANTRAYLRQNIRYLPMMAETLACRYCQRKRLARLIDAGTGWFWRRLPPSPAQVWAFWIWLPPSPAQVSASFGAGHQPSWRRCDFRAGTCAKKRAQARSGGAGHALFSTPAPSNRHTCAITGQTGRHLRQIIDVPAPKPGGTCAADKRYPDSSFHNHHVVPPVRRNYFLAGSRPGKALRTSRLRQINRKIKRSHTSVTV